MKIFRKCRSLLQKFWNTLNLTGWPYMKHGFWKMRFSVKRWVSCYCRSYWCYWCYCSSYWVWCHWGSYWAIYMFQGDEELKLEINSCIKNMSSKKNKAWDKNCLSNGGLKRQITTRYLSSKAKYLKLEWQTIHSTPSTYYLLIPSKYLTSSWKAIFIWCLAFSYIIHLFMKPLPPLIPRQFSKAYYFICICSIKRH